MDTPTFQLVTDKRTTDLGIAKYDTRVVPTPEGLVMVHEAVVMLHNGQPEEARDVMFTVPCVQQDDFELIRNRWATAIEQLVESYARTGRLVSLDIGIPMHIARKAQGRVSDAVKDFVNEDSTPGE
tara:strand:- start:103 stop:480 length:378 start_codon:yes stop_codon:yes gene_type:complete